MALISRRHDDHVVHALFTAALRRSSKQGATGSDLVPFGHPSLRQPSRAADRPAQRASSTEPGCINPGDGDGGKQPPSPEYSLFDADSRALESDGEMRLWGRTLRPEHLGCSLLGALRCSLHRAAARTEESPSSPHFPSQVGCMSLGNCVPGFLTMPGSPWAAFSWRFAPGAYFRLGLTQCKSLMFVFSSTMGDVLRSRVQPQATRVLDSVVLPLQPGLYCPRRS